MLLEFIPLYSGTYLCMINPGLCPHGHSVSKICPVAAHSWARQPSTADAVTQAITGTARCWWDTVNPLGSRRKLRGIPKERSVLSLGQKMLDPKFRSAEAES